MAAEKETASQRTARIARTKADPDAPIEANTRDVPAQPRRRPPAAGKRTPRPTATRGQPGPAQASTEVVSLRRARLTDQPYRRPLIASAARIDLTNPKSVKASHNRRQGWQSEAWEYYDEVPEIGFTNNYLAALMGKLRLFPAVQVTPSSPPVPIDSDDAAVVPGITKEIADLAIDTLARLKSLQGGQSAVVRAISLNFEIAGEGYLHGHLEAPTDQGPVNTTEQGDGYLDVEDWRVRSVDELVPMGDQYELRYGPGQNSGQPLPLGDIVIRLWDPHPRFSGMATCAMRRVLAEAESLLLLGREVRATSKSRLSNGLLLVPDELSVGAADPTSGEGDGELGDPFESDLMDVMTTPIMEEGSPSAVVPLVLRGPAEFLAQVRHLLLDRQLDAVLEQRIEQRILRIARGMNMPVEVTTGLQATTFANAAQVKQSVFDDHIEPRAILVCDAITSGFLQWALISAGVNPEVAHTIFVWFDPEALIAKPNQAETAALAHKDMVISAAARRRVEGYAESDAPDDAERLLTMALAAPRMDPSILGQILKKTLFPTLEIPGPQSGVLGDPNPVSSMPAAPAPPPSATPAEPVAPKPAPNAPPPPNSPPPAVTAAAHQQVQWARLGATLTAIDSQLRAKIIAASDQAMRQALERAGNRLAGKVARSSTVAGGYIKAMIDGVPAAEKCATAGPAALTAAGITTDELLRQSFTGVAADAARWIVAARAEAISAVERVGGLLPEAHRTSMDSGLTTRVTNAQEWLESNLIELAADRLNTPAGTPVTEPLGEHDPTVLVPAGLVRAVVAVAAGQTPKGGSIVAGAWLQIAGQGVTDQDGGPLSGVATAADVMGAVNQLGGQLESWQWDWGAGARSAFQPHLDLDGSTQTSTADFMNNGWPGDPAYPGDHDGCVCDLTPVLVGAGETPLVTEQPTAADLAPYKDALEREAQADADGTPTVSGLAGNEGRENITVVTPSAVAEAEYVASTEAPGVFADRLGITSQVADPKEALSAAKAELPALRADVRATAAKVQEEHEAWLEAMDADRGKLATIDVGSDYRSWRDSLQGPEHDRLRQRWFAAKGDTRALTPDELAAQLNDRMGRDMSTDEALDLWLKETRIVDAAKALANGRAINPAGYGGLDVNTLVDSPFDLDKLFSGKDVAAAHVAQVNTEWTANEAERLLGHPTLGVAPWDMTEADYIAEVSQVDAAAQRIEPLAEDEWGSDYSPEDQRTLSRLKELIPDGIDPTGTLGYDDLYESILTIARQGGYDLTGE